jgi:hypothetical protein
MRTMSNEKEQKTGRGMRGAWWSLAGGTATWAVHLAAVYALTSLACERGLLMGQVAGLPALHLAVTVITAAAAAAIGICLWGAHGAWRHAHRQQDAPAGSGAGVLAVAEHDGWALLALLALLLNTLFLVAVLVTLLPAFVVPPC